eukprot:56896-Eustigmatos_ZCMA.PRE.1
MAHEKDSPPVQRLDEGLKNHCGIVHVVYGLTRGACQDVLKPNMEGCRLKRQCANGQSRFDSADQMGGLIHNGLACILQHVLIR